MEYTTVLGVAEDSFVEKKSRFIAAIAPVRTEEEALEFIAGRKQKYWDSSSTIYGYVLREGSIRRYSDGGEPQGTGGIPVTEVILKSGLTDVCVVVTRYYGGTQLGAGGLVRAFSHGAAIAIEAAQKTTLRPCTTVEMELDYSQYGIINHILPKYPNKLLESDFGVIVKMRVLLNDSDLPAFTKELTESTSATVHPYEVAKGYFDIK